MSQFPEPTPSEQSTESTAHRAGSVLVKVAVAVAAIAAAGGTAAVIYGDRLIENRILPVIETEVTAAIGRPVHLGDVEGLSWRGIRLGETTIPATATDDTSITVDEIGIDIDLRSLIFQQILKPDVVIVRPQVDLVQGTDGQWVEFELSIPTDDEPLLSLELQSIAVQDAQVKASTQLPDPAAVVPRTPVQLRDVDITAEFTGADAQQVRFDVAGQVLDPAQADSGGFEIQGEADLTDRAVQANIRTTEVPTTGINLLLPAIAGLSAGALNTNLTAAAALTDDNSLDLDSVDLQGTARFQDGEAALDSLPEKVRNIRSQLRFQGQRVTLEDTGLQLGDLTLMADGEVDLQAGYNLRAQVPAIALETVPTLIDVDLPVTASGTLQFDATVTGDLLDPQVRGRLTNTDAVQVDRVELAAIAADFTADLIAVDLTELRLVPAEGGVIVANGRADLTELTNPAVELTARVDVPVDQFTTLYGVTLPAETVIGTLTAEVEATGNLSAQTALVNWQLSESTFPGQGELSLADNQVRLTNTRLQVAEGTVTAEAIAQLEGGDWQATATMVQIPVEQFARQAQGLLSADVNAAGNLYALDLNTIEAGGNATIADAEVRLTSTSDPLLPRGDWQTTFAWQGDRVAIEAFSAPGVAADGTIGVDFTQAIPLGAIALNVALQEFDLQPLNSLAPVPVREYAQLAGLTSFDGQITGTLATLALEGNARLDQLAVNDVAFESLRGPIVFALDEGGTLDLRGTRDRLRLAVDDRPWPLEFELRNRDFVASGYGEGHKIYADISDFPLAQLGVQPAVDYGFGLVTGLVNASVEADLTDFANPVASGTLTVDQPGVDPVAAQQITAAFRYADQIATLEQAELLLNDSRFLLTGQARLAPELDYRGELTIAEGQVADLVAIAQRLDLEALGIGLAAPPQGTAADVETNPVGLPSGSFLSQLESFVAYLATRPPETANEGSFAMPPVEDLSGAFAGTLSFAGRSLDVNALTADFDLRGDGWRWGPYAPSNRFIVTGDVRQATVTLDPVTITADDTVITASGSGNINRLQGELLIDNLPIAVTTAVYPLPISLAGELDVITNLDGSLANPQVTGEAVIVDTQIDGQPIHRVGGNFRYRNALLEIDGEAAIDAEDAPITLTGRVPYALPVMTVQPNTDQIAITATVPSDSFDVVNAVTADQVRWEDGTGEIVVQVGGTLAQPAIAGTASFRDGVVSAAQLRDPVTNLTGDVQFNLERIGIQQLRGNLGDGEIAVTGQLPLLPSGQSLLADAATKAIAQQPAADGLRIALTQVPINYSNILEAVFEGEVLIAGAVLEPTVSGQIGIGAGQVQANELLRQAGAIDLPTAEEVEAVNPYRAQYLGIDPLAPQPADAPEGLLDKITLQNLVIELSDRVVVAGQPFYNIAAEGGLTINGSLSELQPEGTIALRSGWINLLSTQFRLDANAPNTATFTPEDGLDPYVDVVLTARVRETDVNPAPPSQGGFVGSEINDNTDLPSVGDVNYINVQAVAEGNASELRDRIALESRPPRSQSELVTLLGNSLAGGLASASFTQVAEFIGAGSIAGFGNNLADTLGLQSFSIFPTTDTAEESTSSVGIGVEASFAISDSIGVNVLEILNSGNPPQIGVQYRFTEAWQLRGVTNLDDSEVRLEYSTSF